MYKKTSHNLMKHIDFMLLDMACLFLAFYFAVYIRFDGFQVASAKAQESVYIATIIIVLFAHVCISIFSSNYKNILKRGYFSEFIAVIKQIFLIVVVLAICVFVMKEYRDLSRGVVLYMFVLAAAFMYVERFFWKMFLLHRRSSHPRLMLVISDEANIKRILQGFQGKILDFQVSGVVVIGGTKKKEILGVPVVAEIENLVSYIELNPIDEILLSVTTNTSISRDILTDCTVMGVTIHVEYPQFEGLAGLSFHENIAGVSVMTNSMNATTDGEEVLKRALDILGGIIGSIITLVLCIFIAPAIYITDPGPIFFKQNRVGKNGRTFKLYKFRSMYKDAEERKAALMSQNEMDGHMFKMENDPRILGSGADGTKKGLGNFIRSTSIDEFPQFFNILMGDMSLVGTRPPTLDEYQQYELHHRARLAIKPGLTGMWQVSGRNQITDFEEVVKLDVEYIQQRSFLLDIKILLKTVVVVLMRKGSK